MSKKRRRKERACHRSVQQPPPPPRREFPTRHSVLALFDFSATSVISSTRIADHMPLINVWNKNQRQNKSERPCTRARFDEPKGDDDDDGGGKKSPTSSFSPRLSKPDLQLLLGHAALFCYPTTQASTVDLL